MHENKQCMIWGRGQLLGGGDFATGQKAMLFIFSSFVFLFAEGNVLKLSRSAQLLDSWMSSFRLCNHS